MKKNELVDVYLNEWNLPDIEEIEENQTNVECVECGDKFNEFQGILEERTCMTCILKAEDPDVIRPSTLTKKGDHDDKL